MYCLVFITRYLDLFIPDMNSSTWNYVLKIFYILSSLYILFLMLRVYARTREREKAWKLGGVAFVGSAIAAPFIMMIFKKKAIWSFVEVRYTNIPPSTQDLVPDISIPRSVGLSPSSSNPSASSLNSCYSDRPQCLQSSIPSTCSC
jgi:hypothetical protein